MNKIIWRVTLADNDKVIEELFARKRDAIRYASYAERRFPQCEIYLERMNPLNEIYTKMVVRDKTLTYTPPF